MRRVKLSNVWPPVVALAVVGTGIGMQRREMAELERGNEVLRRVEKAERPAVPEKVSNTSVITGRRIDWRQLVAMPGWRQSMAITQVRRLLYELSSEELLANLDQLAAVEVSEEMQQELESLLLYMLGRRDPRILFDRFSDELRNERLPLRQSIALGATFRRWVERDCRAAAAWMDEQVAAGAFESKSLNGLHAHRLTFESDLIRLMAAANPASASARVTAMSEPLRSAVLKNDLLLNYRRAEEAKGTANLIREIAGEAQAPQVLAESSRMVALGASGDREAYESLGRLFKDIEATPEERDAVALSSLSCRMQSQSKWVERDDAASYVDAMRTWSLNEAPGVAGSITGNALGQLGMKRFDEAAKLAIQYQEAGGDDSVVVAFLSSKGLAHSHPAEALPLLERISDPEKREAIRKFFPKQP